MQHVSVIRQYISHLGALALVSAAVLAAGCGSKSKESKEMERALERALNPPAATRVDDPTARSPEEVAIKAVAGPRINRDAGGQPLSVVIRIVQLSDKSEFTRLTLESAASKSEKELFPREFVVTNQVVLMPGTTQEFTDKLLPETKYVGVIGLFHRPDARFWRFLFSADAVRKEGLNFVAQDCHFTPITPQFEPLPGQTVSHDAISCPLRPGQPGR